MKTIETITDIDAPADVVWQIITDFDRYPDWNPFITELHGSLHEGARLRATFTLAGRKPQTFTPRITILEPGRRLVWCGGLAIPRLFDAEHTLAVEASGPATVFTHREHFRGVLVPMLGKTLTATHDAFIAMDAALARRAEHQATTTEAKPVR